MSTTSIVVSEKAFTNLVAGRAKIIQTSHRYVDLFITTPKNFDRAVEAKAKERVDQLRWCFAASVGVIIILLGVILWS